MTKRRLGRSTATQVRMEYLRLDNLTEICPSQRVGADVAYAEKPNHEQTN